MSSPNEFFYKLTLKDGREIEVPPHAVAQVQEWIDEKQDFKFTSGTISHYEYRRFEKTSKRQIQVPLLEQAAQAFRQPMVSSDDPNAVKARWVKKQVTTQEYGAYYGRHFSYHKLPGDEAGLVWIAFVMPVHEIDTSRVSYCSPEEVKVLTKYSK